MNEIILHGAEKQAMSRSSPLTHRLKQLNYRNITEKSRKKETK